MKYPWIRIIISLFLILVLIINISPIKAKAGLAEGLISAPLPVEAKVVAGAILVWNSRDALKTAGENDMVSPIMKMALDNCMAAYLLLGGTVLVILAVYPLDKKFAQDQLQSIGLVNHTGAVPVLIRKHRDPDNHRVTIWEFRNPSIPLVAWENKRPDIEAA